MEDIADHPWIDWISANKRVILLGFVAFFGLVVIGYRFAAANTLSSQSDFYQAQNDFTRLQNQSIGVDTTEETENLGKLESILNRHPELHPKYDAAIAQALIIAQEPASAVPFAEKTFLRIKSDPVNFYEDYAKTSLLISEGQYDQALIQAQQLKSNLDKGSAQDFGGTLYVYNLIRIATLHRQLNHPTEELQAWSELEQYKGSVDSLLAVHQLFREGNSSLSHYTAQRKETLKGNTKL